ncbi:MAG: ankyrin repeat domain-containing protein [Candidatus Dependentiae bacterium]
MVWHLGISILIMLFSANIYVSQKHDQELDEYLTKFNKFLTQHNRLFIYTDYLNNNVTQQKILPDENLINFTKNLYEKASKSLIRKDPDNSKKLFIEYPLHEAVRLGMNECVAQLIFYNAKIDAHNHLGQIPLHLTAQLNDENKAIEIAQNLLNAGSDPNTPTRLGDTTIYHAATYGKWKLVELLIENGAYDNPGPMQSIIPLLDKMPNKELAKLLKKFLMVNEQKKMTNPVNTTHWALSFQKQQPPDNDLFRVLKKGDLKRAQLYLNQGVGDNKGPSGSVIPLLLSMEDEKSAKRILVALLAQNSHPNYPTNGDNLLFESLKCKRYKIAKKLLNNNYQDNTGPGGSVLPFVLEIPSEELAKKFLISLIAHNANPNYLIEGNNLLYHALKKKKYEVAKALLTMGANDNQGPSGSVEKEVYASNDIELITSFKIRKELPVPNYFEKLQDLSPRD